MCADKSDENPSMLDWFGQLLKREQEHEYEPAPLLDALLPILEYTPDQLKKGGFWDGVLAAGVKAYARIGRAAAELEPLGIRRSDLSLLLQDRMKEQLERQKKRKRKRKHR